MEKRNHHLLPKEKRQGLAGVTNLEEGSCGGGWLSLEQDVDGLGYGVAELVAPALLLLTALRVLAVTQPV